MKISGLVGLYEAVVRKKGRTLLLFVDSIEKSAIYVYDCLAELKFHFIEN